MPMSERNLYADVVTHDLALLCVDPVGTLTTVDAALGYDPADPFAVTVTFVTVEGDVVWTFARDLLARGLSGPAGLGDVHIWPCVDADGGATVIIELCSPDGELVAQAGTRDIYQFLGRSLAAVPAGTETDGIDLDQLIDQLLQPTERGAGAMTMPTLATLIGASVPTPRATVHLGTSICTCGQDLDVYRSKHCPRCGITLHCARPLTPAA